MTRYSQKEPQGDSLGLFSSADTTPPGWRILFSEGAENRLASVEAAISQGKTTFQIGSQLRADGLAGDEAAALLHQVDLRRKARSKFGSVADGMLFTQAGLEQASRVAVAALHATRFKDAGSKHVADLGCGLGTESIAFLNAGLSVTAVEIDPFTARIAAHNLAHATTSDSLQVRVLTADAAEAIDALQGSSTGNVDAVYFDPARRTAGHRNTKRIANPDDYSPSLTFAFDVAERVTTGIKLGPGFDRELIPEAAEAQWVSVDGQLVETGLWFGDAARHGISRAALILRAGESHELVAAEDSPDAEVRSLGEYLYEPDGSVIRARLIGLLAEQLGAGMLNEGIAYLTSDAFVQTPFAQAFRVTEQLPASEKQLRRALSERDIGTLEIKKRGTDVDPAALRTRLRLKGPNTATLILTRVAGKHVALLATRVESD